MQDSQRRADNSTHFSRRNRRFPYDFLDKEVLFRGAMERISLPADCKKDPIGSGSEASIFKYTDKDDMKAYAVRKVRLLTPDSRQRFHDNLEVLRKLEDTNLPNVEARQYIFKLRKVGLSDEDESDPIGVQIYDWIDGVDLNNKKNCFSAEYTTEIGLKVTQAVEWIHGLNIIHRDIHPRNIVLADEGSIPVLIDFGMAKLKKSQRLTPRFGEFSAPEVNGPKPQWNKASDIYSLGKTLLYLLRDGSHRSQQLNAVLAKCVSEDWRDRLTIQQFKQRLFDLHSVFSLKRIKREVREHIETLVNNDRNNADPLIFTGYKSVVKKFEDQFIGRKLNDHKDPLEINAMIGDFLNQIFECYRRTYIIEEFTLYRAAADHNLDSIYQQATGKPFNEQDRRGVMLVGMLRNYRCHGRNNGQCILDEYCSGSPYSLNGLVLEGLRPLQRLFGLEQLGSLVKYLQS